MKTPPLKQIIEVLQALHDTYVLVTEKQHGGENVWFQFKKHGLENLIQKFLVNIHMYILHKMLGHLHILIILIRQNVSEKQFINKCQYNY